MLDYLANHRLMGALWTFVVIVVVDMIVLLFIFKRRRRPRDLPILEEYQQLPNVRSATGELACSHCGSHHIGKKKAFNYIITAPAVLVCQDCTAWLCRLNADEQFVPGT